MTVRPIVKPTHRGAAMALAACALIAGNGCKGNETPATPPTPQVVQVPDMNLLTIDPKEVAKFPLIPAEKVEVAAEVNATGSVNPDVSREVPVISLANGRVVDIKARLGDNVKKGQLLFRVQSPDISTGFNAYLKAVNDEQLANKADIRAQDLLKHGAISQAMVEQADDAERNAKADLDAAEEQLKILGVDKAHPSSVVDVHAPISGVIINQNVTEAAAAGVSLSGSSTAFTIADLSEVWILCDVYENDIPKLQVGQQARIKVNAYPERPVIGRISDIGPVLDPQLRTAKVRIQVNNPGFLRLGMFVTATFTSRKTESHAGVPADAVLHLHDRDWVFVPAGDNRFRRTEVRAGQILSGNRQVILSGIEPGQQVVSNALQLESAGTQ
ncbi:MAG TPA: efflux RND transporter periplasmic adaptor subunit [Terracidiphilus sp.]|jgi:cobalt-zinc-cadmium efflux system membrane fusion protein